VPRGAGYNIRDRLFVAVSRTVDVAAGFDDLAVSYLVRKLAHIGNFENLHAHASESI